MAKSKYGTQRGDLKKMVERVVNLVKGTSLAGSKPMPKTLLIGINAVRAIRLRYEKTLRNLEDWEEISCSIDHENIVVA